MAARNEKEFSEILKEKYRITLKVSRGCYGYIHPDRNKPIRGRMLGTGYTEKYLAGIFSQNIVRSSQAQSRTTAPTTLDISSKPAANEESAPAKPSLVGWLHVQQEISMQHSSEQMKSGSQFARPSRRKRINVLQESAEAVAFLQENGYTSINELKNELEFIQSEETSLLRTIEKADKGIDSLNEQLHYTGQYYARKQIYKEFCQSKNKGKFRAAHSTAIREFEDARHWLHSSVDNGTLPTYHFIESEEGKFPGLRTVREVRDRQIEKRNKLRDQLKTVKQKKDQLGNLLQKVQALIQTPAIEKPVNVRKRGQQSL